MTACTLKWVNATALLNALRDKKARPETITTFRRGTKWANPNLVGKLISLVNCSEYHDGECGEHCDTIAVAVVMSMSVQAFQDISDLDYRRLPVPMDSDKALEDLRRVYGTYKPTDLTTVLTLRLVSVVQNLKTGFKRKIPNG